MIWLIDDYNNREILFYNQVTDFLVPKFPHVTMEVNEPELTIRWVDLMNGSPGERRQIIIDYRDVAGGYSGYIGGASSAQDLANQIEVMVDSGFNSGGDTLVNKGDIMSHNGVSDEIFPLGTNEFVHIVNTAQSTGHQYVAKSVIVDGGLSTTDTNSAKITKVGASISVETLHRNYPIVAFCNQAVADGATYFFNGSGTNLNAVAAAQKNAYPPAGTMLGVHMEWMAYSTAGSNENISIYLRFNDTTDYLIATVGNTNFVKVFENLSLNGGSGVAFNGTTDFYCYKLVCPTWSNNPTTVGMQGWTNYKLTL